MHLLIRLIFVFHAVLLLVFCFSTTSASKNGRFLVQRPLSCCPPSWWPTAQWRRPPCCSRKCWSASSVHPPPSLTLPLWGGLLTDSGSVAVRTTNKRVICFTLLLRILQWTLCMFVESYSVSLTFETRNTVSVIVKS